VWSGQSMDVQLIAVRGDFAEAEAAFRRAAASAAALSGSSVLWSRLLGQVITEGRENHTIQPVRLVRRA